jgi:hypothetical protein
MPRRVLHWGGRSCWRSRCEGRDDVLRIREGEFFGLGVKTGLGVSLDRWTGTSRRKKSILTRPTWLATLACHGSKLGSPTVMVTYRHPGYTRTGRARNTVTSIQQHYAEIRRGEEGMRRGATDYTRCRVSLAGWTLSGFCFGLGFRFGYRS